MIINVHFTDLNKSLRLVRWREVSLRLYFLLKLFLLHKLHAGVDLNVHTQLCYILPLYSICNQLACCTATATTDQKVRLQLFYNTVRITDCSTHRHVFFFFYRRRSFSLHADHCPIRKHGTAGIEHPQMIMAVWCEICDRSVKEWLHCVQTSHGN